MIFFLYLHSFMSKFMHLLRARQLYFMIMISLHNQNVACSQ